MKRYWDAGSNGLCCACARVPPIEGKRRCKVCSRGARDSMNKHNMRLYGTNKSNAGN